MREDLLREISEIKRDLQGLNDRLEKVTDVLLQEENKIEDSPINLVKGRDLQGNVYTQSIPQPIPQPIPTNHSLPNSQTSTPLSDFFGQQPSPIPTFVSQKPKKASIDLETNLGKNVMSILASILIFIGLISFVAFVFTDLSEMLKMGVMFLFSFGLFGVGVWRVEKNKNALSLGLSSCGIGAVFISILLSCFYFEFITNEFLLFGLLVGWSVVGLLLSKRYESDLFVIISYIGFYIALLLGAFSGIELFGYEICTVALMIILHALFTYFIGSRKIPTTKKLYTVFPFISLFGSFILIVNVFNLGWYSYGPFKAHSLLLIASMLIQTGVSLYYIFKLQQFRLSQTLVTAVLILTCIVNIMGMLGTSLEYVVRYSNIDINAPYFSTMFEKEVDDLQDYYDYDYYNNYSTTYSSSNIEDLQCMPNPMRDDERFIGLSMIFAALVHILFIEWSRKKLGLMEYEYKTARYIGWFGLSIFSALVFCIDPMYKYIVSLFGLAIPAGLLLWFGREDKDLFKVSQLVYFLGLFTGCVHQTNELLAENLWVFILFAVLQIGYLVLSGIILKQNYRLGNKIWYYFVSIFAVLFVTNIIADYVSITTSDAFRIFYEKSLEGKVFIQEPESYWENYMWIFLKYNLPIFINFIVMAIIGLFVKLSSFCQNWNSVEGLKKSENASLDCVYNFNNAFTCILLLAGVTLVHEMAVVGVAQFIAVLISSLLCFIGCKELLSRNNRILEYYVGIKATLFINIVMAAFIDSELGYIYSIVCLLIAICSIVLGFAKELKSFRLYGLILSICSVLKLVMIDISYDNSLGRIFSFMISGLLCFAIVWIYNRMSEKLNK